MAFDLPTILMAGYGRWKQTHPDGTYSEYWYQVNKSYTVDFQTGEWQEVHKYRSRESAGRAFRKITRGQTSGKRIASEITATGREPIGERYPRPGARPTGAWQVVIRFLNFDEDGNLVQCYASNGEDCIISFDAYSFEYTTLADVPYLEEKLQPIVEEKVNNLISEDGNDYNTYCGVVCQTYRVEIYPIRVAHPKGEVYEVEAL